MNVLLQRADTKKLTPARTARNCCGRNTTGELNMMTDAKSGAAPAPGDKDEVLVDLGTMSKDTKAGTGNGPFDGYIGYWDSEPL
jgi:hypothetical protein